MKPKTSPPPNGLKTLNIKIQPDLWDKVREKAEEMTRETGFTITITDIVKRALAEYVS